MQPISTLNGDENHERSQKGKSALIRFISINIPLFYWTRISLILI